MKSRIYKTLSGKEVKVLRPETPAEVAALEQAFTDEENVLDVRHSLGDGRGSDEPSNRETDE